VIYLGCRNRTKSNIVKTVNPVFMKRRVCKIANFFAFNLLFFALYLNFIHKDRPMTGAVNTETAQQQSSTAAFSGTVLVDNPEKYTDKKSEQVTVSAQSTDKAQDNSGATKLSIN